MEACASSHHWGRAIGDLGYEVRLIPPAYVKPFVKRKKDKVDVRILAQLHASGFLPEVWAANARRRICGLSWQPLNTNRCSLNGFCGSTALASAVNPLACPSLRSPARPAYWPEPGSHREPPDQPRQSLGIIPTTFRITQPFEDKVRIDRVAKRHLSHGNTGRRRLQTDRPLLVISPEPPRPSRHTRTLVSTILGGQ